MRKGRPDRSGRPLTPGPDRFGHLYVKLQCPDGKERRVAVHRLVLLAFVGPCPEGMECCHGPGGPADNRLTNLRWDTRGANRLDAYDDSATRGAYAHPNAKLTPEQVNEIRAAISGGMSNGAIGQKYGVSRFTIHRIRHGGWSRVPA